MKNKEFKSIDPTGRRVVRRNSRPEGTIISFNWGVGDTPSTRTAYRDFAATMIGVMHSSKKSGIVRKIKEAEQKRLEEWDAIEAEIRRKSI